MTNRTFASGIALCGLVALACNGSNDFATSWSTIGAGGSGTCMPQRDEKDHPFTPPAGVAGTWTGYFQGTNVPVGEDAVKLTIDQAADGSNQIHVVFGTSPPPPPATVATDPYPADVITNQSGSPSNLDGFPYPAHEVQWIGPRLKFAIANTEAWDGWCKLQQSYWINDGSGRRYKCAPGNGAMVPTYPPAADEMCTATYNDNRSVPFDCDLLILCNGQRICACDECGCAASVSPSLLFDVTFDGDTATGTGPTNVGASYVRLTRSAN